MSRFAAAPILYKQSIAPDNTSDYGPTLGDIWMDTSLSPPVTKKCTAMYPFTWSSIEGGGSSINFADEEIPGGTINGSNVTFTLAHSPNSAASLQLYRNGVMQQQGSGKDYTLSAATITFTTAPLTGDTLLAWYRF